MKKVFVLLLAICGFISACQKSVPAPVTYKVESGQNAPLGDIYIPDNGTYTMPVLVKYISGYAEDKVSLSIKGVPANVTVVQDKFSQVPTYRADYVFVSKDAKHGSYPVSITSTSRGSDPKTYTFNVIVRSADCASNLWGSFSAFNECTGRSFSYTATGQASGVTDELNVVNLGGYGSNTSTRVILNCNLNTLTIPSQNIGNGYTMQGTGTFTGNSMKINYSVTSSAGGASETCITTLTK